MKTAYIYLVNIIGALTVLATLIGMVVFIGTHSSWTEAIIFAIIGIFIIIAVMADDLKKQRAKQKKGGAK